MFLFDDKKEQLLDTFNPSGGQYTNLQQRARARFALMRSNSKKSKFLDKNRKSRNNGNKVYFTHQNEDLNQYNVAGLSISIENSLKSRGSEKNIQTPVTNKFP
jgi:hypothetical protein